MLVLSTSKSPKGTLQNKDLEQWSDVFSVESILQISAPLIPIRYARA